MMTPLVSRRAAGPRPQLPTPTATAAAGDRPRAGLVLFAAALLAGCAAPTVHLAPGDKIIADDSARAAAIRQILDTDTGHTGRVVLVEHPLKLSR